ncbi:hypothetical protein [Actinoplanes siamensis]|uniref:Uncharacterized protein n=1 Tax=Actinoplanes siamensis TaxID=1223317 RepID=A0A919N673_9ACTN|nr:hypothetical protein [Actinoplanes siamensis]GIF05115.1 hypothetical protein Asi03nite_26530 [Actinoplanes siamensis]
MLTYLKWHMLGFPIQCYDEVDEEQMSLRHIAFNEELDIFEAAASLAETLHARDTGGLKAVVAYEYLYGPAPEAPIPDVDDGAELISAKEFDEVWRTARAAREADWGTT